MRLLLHAGGSIASAMADTADQLRGAAAAVFVPYAVSDLDACTDSVRLRFGDAGVRLTGLHRCADPATAAAAADAIVVGGGNSFRLARALQRLGLIEPIRSAVAGGAAYWGASAGANVAGPTIRTTNDMPIVEPAGFDALGLVPFQINPHYLDPPPPERRVGETREQRLEEFLEDNDVPVVALREESWLLVEGPIVTLRGTAGAVLFSRSESPRQLQPGADLSDLLLHPGRFDVPRGE